MALIYNSFKSTTTIYSFMYFFRQCAANNALNVNVLLENVLSKKRNVVVKR